MTHKTHVKTLDLGRRKVTPMNFSKVITLPRTFTDNYLGKNMTVQVSLSGDGKLILTPVRDSKGGDNDE